MVFAGASVACDWHAGIALHANRKHDGAGGDRFAVRERQIERGCSAGNGSYLTAIANVDTEFVHIALPAIQYGFTGSGRKLQIAAQGHDSRLGHDVLAFLVSLNGVRRRFGCFEQQV